jgi:L-lysine 6-transaminase
MCAFDVQDADTRKRLLAACFDQGLMLVASGERSIRFRPALTITASDVDEALALLERAIVTL